jgi:hypothetical protein
MLVHEIDILWAWTSSAGAKLVRWAGLVSEITRLVQDSRLREIFPRKDFAKLVRWRQDLSHTFREFKLGVNSRKFVYLCLAYSPLFEHIVYNCGHVLKTILIFIGMYEIKVQAWTDCLKITTLQITFWESIIFSSLLSSQNLFSSRGLVKISVNYSLVLTCEIIISPFTAWSLKKWCRMSMCLVLECS